MPLKIIFGPIIKTFWGEAFLHYPANFFLLPKLASFARMGLAVLIGSLLTGMAVGMVHDLYSNKRINLKNSFKLALKHYISLVIIVFIFTASFYILRKALTILLIKYFSSGHSRLLFMKADIWLSPIFTFLNFVLGIILQAIFAYAIPFVIIGKEKILVAIVKSFILFKNLFWPTTILVGLPMLLYIPMAIVSYNNIFLINRFFPEITLWILILTTFITSLVIDSIITVSTTLLYLEKEK